MASPKLHVVFSPAAAGDLREALELLGCADRVITLFDDLSVGPIASLDWERRAAWIKAERGEAARPDPSVAIERFWRDALANDNPVIWTSRRCTRDYVGFLALVCERGDRPCEVVDLTEALIFGDDGRLSEPELALTLGMFNPAEILTHKLFDLAGPLGAEGRARAAGQWAKLRDENAPLRIIAPDLSLVSAPLDYFDATLLSCVRKDWLKTARVISDVLVQFSDEGRLQVDDRFLAMRLVALAAAGQIESRGNLRHIRYSEVRLPQAQLVSA